MQRLDFRTHLQDLKDVTSDVHYESFRAEQLLGRRNINDIYITETGIKSNQELN